MTSPGQFLLFHAGQAGVDLARFLPRKKDLCDDLWMYCGIENILRTGQPVQGRKEAV